MEAKTKKMGLTYSLYKSYIKIAHASEQSLSALRLIGTLKLHTNTRRTFHINNSFKCIATQ